jgi:ribosomal protein S27E
VPEKRVLPLNNPVSQKSTNHQDKINPLVMKKVTGVSKGGEGKSITIYMFVRCRQCGKEQQVVVDYQSTSKWHRCGGCKELQPLAGFAVIAHANYPLGR